MSLTLQVRLPSSIVVVVDVEGSDTAKVLKAKVASSAGLDADLFSLIFEGSELEEGKKICEFPFEDQSELFAGFSKKQVAAQHMKDLEWSAPWEGAFIDWLVGFEGDKQDIEECDAKYVKVLQVMHEADMCGNREFMSEMLVDAAGAGFTKCVEFLLVEELADPNSTIGSSGGSTPLHRAVEENHIGVTQALLRYNADPNKSDNFGDTSLHSACMTGNRTCATMLIASNADITALNHRGMTPNDWILPRPVTYVPKLKEEGR